MKLEDIKTVAIIGTGMIGSSLATMFLGNGYSAVLIGRTPESLSAGKENVARNFADLVAKGIATEEQTGRALSRLVCTSDYSSLKEVQFVMEAVAEDVSVKSACYAKAEEYLPEDAVIASATSAISADVLVEGIRNKERFLVAHPWNPPHLVPLVEISRSAATSDAAAALTKELIDFCGHKAVILNKNITGFVGNRLQHAMLREALYLVEEGVVSAEQIDEVVLYGFGPRYSSIGIMEHYDTAGLPLQLQVQSNLFPTLCNATGPQKVLTDLLAEGKLGVKTKEGVLDWHEKDMEDFRRRQQAPYLAMMKWKWN